MLTGKLWGGPYECLWYAYGRLSGNAASHILPWMIANADSPTTVNDDTVTKLFEHLDLLSLLLLRRLSRLVILHVRTGILF